MIVLLKLPVYVAFLQIPVDGGSLAIHTNKGQQMWIKLCQLNFFILPTSDRRWAACSMY